MARIVTTTQTTLRLDPCLQHQPHVVIFPKDPMLTMPNTLISLKCAMFFGAFGLCPAVLSPFEGPLTLCLHGKPLFLLNTQ